MRLGRSALVGEMSFDSSMGQLSGRHEVGWKFRKMRGA